jgi:hypothetical protein
MSKDSFASPSQLRVSLTARMCNEAGTLTRPQYTPD